MRLTLKKIGGLSRGQILILLLLFNSFSWYFLGRLIAEDLAKLAIPLNDSRLFLESLYPISIIVSALIGALFSTKLQRHNFLFIWLFSGVVASLLPVVQLELRFGDSLIMTAVVITVLGSSLGFGMPALLSHFTENTPIEKRGKMGGLTFLMLTISASSIMFLFLIGKPTEQPLSISSLSLVFLALWRSWSLPVMLAAPRRISAKLYPEKRKRGRSLLPNMFRNRAFILYFLAWLLFSMVDGFQEYILPVGAFDPIMNVVELVVAGISAFFAGVVADRIGRKKIILSGFVSLGVAYSILSLGPDVYHVKYFFVIVDGFAIGLLWTMFTIVLWGELSRINIEKHYAVGEIPYFLTQLVTFALISAPSLGLTKGSVFPLAAFFLFIAVIPLLYAPETLPEEKIQERELKMYTEEALRFRQEAEQKIKS